MEKCGFSETNVLSELNFQALEPYGIGVATGEHCQNRVMFKQFLSSGAMQYCQIDACRLGGPNEIIPIILMAAKFNGKISIQHSSGSNKESVTLLSDPFQEYWCKYYCCLICLM